MSQSRLDRIYALAFGIIIVLVVGFLGLRLQVPNSQKSKKASDMSELARLNARLNQAMVAEGLATATPIYDPNIKISADLMRLNRTVTQPILKPASGKRNAAIFYIRALNAYNKQRQPYLFDRAFRTYIHEPPITQAELVDLLTGAGQRHCNFYLLWHKRPEFAFIRYIAVRNSHFRMLRRISFQRYADPFQQPSFISPLRSLAQVALDRGLLDEMRGGYAAAKRIYLAVIRMGAHLQENPGSLSQLELGFDITRNGLHYLIHMLRKHGGTAELTRYNRLANIVDSALMAERLKYADLDDVEMSAITAQDDSSPMWRVESVVSLISRLKRDDLNGEQRRLAQAVLWEAKHGSDEWVRQTVAYMEHLQTVAYIASKADAHPKMRAGSSSALGL